MLAKIVRSPLTQLFFLALVFGFFGLRLYAPAFFEEHILLLCVFLLATTVFFFTLIIIHNRKNPQRKINLNSWKPYEMKEEDEGLKWVTFQACRKVYIFYAFAIPVSAILIINLYHYRSVPLFVLFLMGSIQYVIFWWEERKYLKFEEELD